LRALIAMIKWNQPLLMQFHYSASRWNLLRNLGLIQMRQLVFQKLHLLTDICAYLDEPRLPSHCPHL